MPRLQNVLAEKATMDLKPILGDARETVASAIAELQKSDEGVRVAADIRRLDLANIAYDSKTLRLIVEASGSINVTVAALPGF
jgi:hypothetical protein